MRMWRGGTGTASSSWGTETETLTTTPAQRRTAEQISDVNRCQTQHVVC